MLKIGDFSKLTRVSIRMLRHYDEIGLLKPAEIDPFTGYRFYSEHQLPVACRIAALKDMGFSLAEIREMLDCYDRPGEMERYFSIRRAAIVEMSVELSRRMRLLDTAIERLRKGENMHYDVTIRTIPQRIAACARMILPSYQDEGMLWGILMGETAHLNLIEDDPCLCSVTFHDGEWKESDVDLEAQKTVRGSYSDTEHVTFRVLPPVTVASATYRGSYDQIGEVYAAIYAWAESNGYRAGGPMMNIYHVSPHETENPDEFVTEVCLPILAK